MSKKNLSLEIEQVLILPKCHIDGCVSSMAHVDICSAKRKQGGIHVTIYPVVENKIKKPREIRQTLIMDSHIQKEVVNLVQKKKRKEKAKKKPLSEKHLPVRDFISV